MAAEKANPELIREKLEKNLFRHSKAPFGYRMVDGEYVVVPEQAGVLKEIFNMVLAGNGTPLIARELNRLKIPTGTTRKDGSPGIWSSSMVLGIITNEFYTGDILKYKHDLKVNYSENPDDETLAPFLLRDHHEALVDRETFRLANAVTQLFGLEKGRVRNEMNPNPDRGKTALTGKLRCGVCGASMKRVTQRTNAGTVFHWSCTVHLRDRKACPMKRVREETVKNAFITLANKLSYLRSGIDAAAGSSIPDFHPLEEFNDALFRNTVLSVDVTTGEKIVFHLTYDLVLTERIAPVGKEL